MFVYFSKRPSSAAKKTLSFQTINIALYRKMLTKCMLFSFILEIFDVFGGNLNASKTICIIP